MSADNLNNDYLELVELQLKFFRALNEGRVVIRSKPNGNVHRVEIEDPEH